MTELFPIFADSQVQPMGWVVSRIVTPVTDRNSYRAEIRRFNNLYAGSTVTLRHVTIEGGVLRLSTSGRVVPMEDVTAYALDRIPGFDRSCHLDAITGHDHRAAATVAPMAGTQLNLF